MFNSEPYRRTFVVRLQEVISNLPSEVENIATADTTFVGRGFLSRRAK
jgi:hypothetical protein